MGTVATAWASTLESIDYFRDAARAKIAQEEATFSKPVFSFTDLLNFAKSGEAGDAKLFALLFAGKLLKDHSSDRWYRFTGHHWEEDLLNEALARVEDLIPHYVTAARQCAEQELKATQASNKNVAEQAKETREIFLKKIAHLQRRRYRENILVLAAAGEGSLGITGSEWDLDPYLLPFKNGVLNLKDRSFRPGRPEDYIKLVCPTEWRGFDVPAPRFEKFLLEIMDGDRDRVAYMKRLLGYGISGLPSPETNRKRLEKEVERLKFELEVSYSAGQALLSWYHEALDELKGLSGEGAPHQGPALKVDPRNLLLVPGRYLREMVDLAGKGDFAAAMRLFHAILDAQTEWDRLVQSLDRLGMLGVQGEVCIRHDPERFIKNRLKLN
ncbi:MAG: hypothetical protein FJ135_15310 [Deltaproteobacteria bacterium]|nr:hypothetical protein [Deltaproteobacteria bacterium]